MAKPLLVHALLGWYSESYLCGPVGTEGATMQWNSVTCPGCLQGMIERLEKKLKPAEPV